MRGPLYFFAFMAGAHALTQPVVKRSSLDVCAWVDASLSVPNLLTGSPIVLGHLDVCLCISGIPAFVKTNPLAVLATALVGIIQTQTTLTALVTASSNSHHCLYPDHCDAVCSAINPCGFQCHNGFTAYPASNPTDCICEPPKFVCNGVCTSDSCPTSTPHKRDVNEWKKRAICDAGLTACGVYDNGKKGTTNLYDCIDTTTDLESCGGCSIPLHEQSPLGVDCTALPGVSDVLCKAGFCYVQQCMPGYILAHDNSTCVDVEEYYRIISASEYGLEHIPLGGIF